MIIVSPAPCHPLTWFMVPFPMAYALNVANIYKSNMFNFICYISKIKINAGDWVSISSSYAKEHGRYNLRDNYKILSKTVTAKELCTDANSIHEWGYNP